MATGASTADLAVILVDAANVCAAAVAQARLHRAVCGIPRVVSVNKMTSPATAGSFRHGPPEFDQHLESLGTAETCYIPISALEGDNVVAWSDRNALVPGPNLLEHRKGSRRRVNGDGPLRFPVQHVLPPRCQLFAATRASSSPALASGRSRHGPALGRTTRVKSCRPRRRSRGKPAPPCRLPSAWSTSWTSAGDCWWTLAACLTSPRRFEATHWIWDEQEPLRPTGPT